MEMTKENAYTYPLNGAVLSRNEMKYFISFLNHHLGNILLRYYLFFIFKQHLEKTFKIKEEAHTYPLFSRFS